MRRLSGDQLGSSERSSYALAGGKVSCRWWLPSLFATKTSAGRVMQLGSPPQRMLAKATSLPFGDQVGWFSGSREPISRLGVPPGRRT